MVTNERMKVVSQKKQRYRANIAGKTYTILGTKSHQHMHSVIKLLNEQWNELGEVAKECSNEEKAILLAINAVSVQLEKQEQLMMLEEENQQLKKNLPHHRGSKRQSIALERKEQFEKQFAEQEDLWRK